jgi:hypothetical protein
MPRHDPLPNDSRTHGRAMGFRIGIELRSLRKRRRPPEGGEPIPAVPPRGPLPLQGGAEAGFETP